MKNKKLNPDIEGPKYGVIFDVTGFQAQDKKGAYTELIETLIPGLRLRTRREYLKWKETLGAGICEAFNMTLYRPWEKIVSFRVQYLGDNGEHYI